MVKIRDDLPKTSDGSIDIQKWVERIGLNRPAKEQTLLKQAALLNLEHGGHHLTCVNESCLRQGLMTAETLGTLEPDIETLLAAIVYFPAHYGELSLEEIKNTLGAEVSNLVSGVIHITTRTHQAKGTSSTAYHDNLRKMLLAVVEDVRVVLIKLAERITSLRAATVLDKETRHQFALETRDIYAPLANRLGIGQIKWELEDFAFRYLEPEAYKHIAKLLDEKRLDREIYVKNVIEQLKQALSNEHIEAEITGRVKHIYSIWRKMNRKNLDFSDIYDVRAVRILVPEVRDCYAALGIVHSLWQHIPKEFDDYIATPKENGYRSLHTAVIGPEGRTLEIQIRTFSMHQEAELGVAAHWLYKEGGKLDPGYQKKLNALRQILDWSEQAQDGDVNELLLQELLEDRVYIFTPQGDVVDLPQGATPLDFAYHIHTDLGHSCRGAKVNGSIVTLNYPLSSGEQVEILSVKSGTPSRDWLNPNLGYLRSARARAKVHNWFKRQARDQNVAQGKEMLEREFKRMGLEIGGLGKILSKLGVKSIEDLYAALGGGDLRTSQIVNALQRVETLESAAEDDITAHLARPSSLQQSEITIQGVGNLLCHFGRCCKPLPGDRIVGYITLGRGVTIHRQDCINVLNKPEEEQRLIQVDWGETRKNVYPVDINIKAYDRQGLLRDITSILSNEKINVIAVNTLTNKDDNIANLVLTLEISDLGALTNILNKIGQLPNVLEVQRLHSTHSDTRK
ncbi:MAG: GTP diphosphokinase [Gammaproteobacteria bacterium 39-13]|nr:GTP diphosphokinase [Gammaproteobacteria bacterium]OJV85322.1 MAG: GTP diphosphokinase [Gammaproteobacteria bacterium 39-13]